MSLRQLRRSDFVAFQTIPTRWMDNDIYGHVNNVNYYSFFDTAVNRYLIEAGALDIHAGEVIGFVVETSCNYFSPLAFPDTVVAGVRVAKIGRSSVRYEVGLFRNLEDQVSAAGHFIHVYVERSTQKPTELPAPLRSAVAALLPQTSQHP
jgi:acyl-CoA thioester hydrolase